LSLQLSEILENNFLQEKFCWEKSEKFPISFGNFAKKIFVKNLPNLGN